MGGGGFVWFFLQKAMKLRSASSSFSILSVPFGRIRIGVLLWDIVLLLFACDYQFYRVVWPPLDCYAPLLPFFSFCFHGNLRVYGKGRRRPACLLLLSDHVANHSLFLLYLNPVTFCPLFVSLFSIFSVENIATS